MPATTEKYAKQKMASLLDRVGSELARAAAVGDEESIHDFRVSIRRFTQALRVFSQFVHPPKAKKIRRKLREAMDLASEVRNCDIAGELLERAGVPARSPARRKLAFSRKEAYERLLESVRGLNRRNFSRKWRERLGL
jgi:CHAD domain-containing protein